MAKRKTRSLNIPAKYPDRADRMILGDGCIFSTDCRKTGLNNNILVVGGSGSGKTVSIVEPFLLESFSRSIVCSVTKRGIVNKFIPLLQNRGYKILDLDFVHPSRGNVCFDPLDYINSFADISFLSQSIISGTRRNRNPDLYWDESAASLLNALIAETLMLITRHLRMYWKRSTPFPFPHAMMNWSQPIWTKSSSFWNQKIRSIMLPPTGGLSAICLSKQRAACSALCIPL